MKSIGLWLCVSSSLLVPQLGFGLQNAPLPGAQVSVKLADAIDSDHDSFGKQYQAFLTEPLALPDGQTIPAASRATVSLVHNNTGWLTQLTAIVANGRTFPVLSSAGSVIGQESKPSESLLTMIGLAPSTPPLNVGVRLASSTQLRFLLIASANPILPMPVWHRSAPANVPHPAVQQTAGVAYLCRAVDASDRSPNPYYVADVQKTRDNPDLVESSWHQYLVTSYPYHFANNPHATVQCSRLQDETAVRDARKTLQGETSGLVQTKWHYTLGPVPAIPR